MARDYKHRANTPKKATAKKKPRATRNARARVKAKPVKNQVPLVRWVLVIMLLVGFAYFLYSLSEAEPEKHVTAAVINKVVPVKLVNKPKKAAPERVVKITAIKKPVQTDIQYDFYTLLPEGEFFIPDHEVKSHKRAERVGKEMKNREYSVQVSSFRRRKDADSLKAKLLLLGFIPKIEKAKVAGATWFRVKIGPYQQMKSVDAIVLRLRESKIDAMVTAVNK